MTQHYETKPIENAIEFVFSSSFTAGHGAYSYKLSVSQVRFVPHLEKTNFSFSISFSLEMVSELASSPSC